MPTSLEKYRPDISIQKPDIDDIPSETHPKSCLDEKVSSIDGFSRENLPSPQAVGGLRSPMVLPKDTFGEVCVSNGTSAVSSAQPTPTSNDNLELQQNHNLPNQQNTANILPRRDKFGTENVKFAANEAARRRDSLSAELTTERVS